MSPVDELLATVAQSLNLLPKVEGKAAEDEAEISGMAPGVGGGAEMGRGLLEWGVGQAGGREITGK